MIILQFDRGYYKWGKLFLVSLTKNFPGETVYINSVNLYSFQIKKLKKLYSPLIIENKKIKMRKKERGNIMISRKPYVLKEAVEKFNEERYLMLDADMIVRKPLDSLFHKLDNSEGGFCLRDGIWEGKVYDFLKVASGVILIKPSCMPLVDRWIEIMETEKEISGVGKGKWYWDQITLWRAIKDNNGLNIANIGIKYYQSDFNDDDAVIWSANLPNKVKIYKDFKKEILKNSNV